MHLVIAANAPRFHHICTLLHREIYTENVIHQRQLPAYPALPQRPHLSLPNFACVDGDGAIVQGQLDAHLLPDFSPSPTSCSIF